MGKTRARSATAGITLDTGALIALDRGDKRMIALLDQAVVQRRNFHIPSGVVGQAWRDGRIQWSRPERVVSKELHDAFRSAGRVFVATRMDPGHYRVCSVSPI